MIGQKLKTAPTTDGHVFQQIGTTFGLLTKFHEDGTRNVASRCLRANVNGRTDIRQIKTSHKSSPEQSGVDAKKYPTTELIRRRNAGEPLEDNEDKNALPRGKNTWTDYIVYWCNGVSVPTRWFPDDNSRTLMPRIMKLHRERERDREREERRERERERKRGGGGREGRVGRGGREWSEGGVEVVRVRGVFLSRSLFRAPSSSLSLLAPALSSRERERKCSANIGHWI
ncbi:hypothetical protein DPMN_149360 [Dreissena polymorpha]|uniref:Uncharacterized protein n=1 Tax=Dreissena polymorpha TaxID=45954 RepID=A0A9D4J4M3_DREPO|nr:hypothetical protein DPMN_149360 [Dreissena polymorpha]